MTTVLVSRQFAAEFGDKVKALATKAGKSTELMTLPEAKGARLSQADCERIDATFIDRDIRFDDHLFEAYGDAMLAAKNLKWIQVQSSGINPWPFIVALDKQGATITTSTGTNAEPVAQTGFTHLLMLARGFSTYVRGQQAHEWRPLRGAMLPNDLRGQTLILIGVGAVGKTFAGYARAFGIKVIGVRRSPVTANDPVDEMHHPSKLLEILPRADWVVISCPLTKETQNLMSREAIGKMKKGARIINIGRGEVLDETAMLDALKSGHLGGAGLDALTEEPLARDSPLWDLPNVVISPHNASASTGNERRGAEMFVANFANWIRGEALFNVQRPE